MAYIYLYNSITPNRAEYSIATSLSDFMTELGTPYATIDKTDCRIVNNELLTNQASPNTTYVIDFDEGKCYFVTSMIEYSTMTKLFLKTDNWGTYSRRALLNDGRITQTNMNVGTATINTPFGGGDEVTYAMAGSTDYPYSNSYVIAKLIVDYSSPISENKTSLFVKYGPLGTTMPENLSVFLSTWAEIEDTATPPITPYSCAVTDAWVVPFNPSSFVLSNTQISAPSAPGGFPTLITDIRQPFSQIHRIELDIPADVPGKIRKYGTYNKRFPKQMSTATGHADFVFQITPDGVSVQLVLDNSVYDVTDDFVLATGFATTENSGLKAVLKSMEAGFSISSTFANIAVPGAGQIVSLAGQSISRGGGGFSANNTRGAFGSWLVGTGSSYGPFFASEFTSSEADEEMENAKSFGLNTDYVFSNKTIAQVLSTGSNQYYTSTYKPFYKVDTTISGIPTDAADEIKRILSEGVRVNASISS